MNRRTMAGFLLAAALALPAGAQEKPPGQEKKLVFNFKEASVDAVLQYVCRELNWTLVYGAKPEGTVSAFSDSEIPEGRVLDFLNTALVKAKVQVFQFGGVLKVVS